MYRLSLDNLTDEELNKIQGGEEFVNDESIEFATTDTNKKFWCSCDGTGNNSNHAAFCSCTDRQCPAPSEI